VINLNTIDLHFSPFGGLGGNSQGETKKLKPILGFSFYLTAFRAFLLPVGPYPQA
jgi:hypothetical protein